jgi:hypothetical protein
MRDVPGQRIVLRRLRLLVPRDDFRHRRQRLFRTSALSTTRSVAPALKSRIEGAAPPETRR